MGWGLGSGGIPVSNGISLGGQQWTEKHNTKKKQELQILTKSRKRTKRYSPCERGTKQADPTRRPTPGRGLEVAVGDPAAVGQAQRAAVIARRAAHTPRPARLIGAVIGSTVPWRVKGCVCIWHLCGEKHTALNSVKQCTGQNMCVSVLLIEHQRFF